MRPIRLLVCSALLLAGTTAVDAQWLNLRHPVFRGFPTVSRI